MQKAVIDRLDLASVALSLLDSTLHGWGFLIQKIIYTSINAFNTAIRRYCTPRSNLALVGVARLVRQELRRDANNEVVQNAAPYCCLPDVTRNCLCTDLKFNICN